MFNVWSVNINQYSLPTKKQKVLKELSNDITQKDRLVEEYKEKFANPYVAAERGW
jgi:acetyl-CoA carboxylase carboxyltransferase component